MWQSYPHWDYMPHIDFSLPSCAYPQYPFMDRLTKYSFRFGCAVLRLFQLGHRELYKIALGQNADELLGFNDEETANLLIVKSLGRK